MKTTIIESLAALERSADRIHDILRQANSLRLRAPLVAELLRALWPASPLYACLLEGEGDSLLAVLDERGKLRVEWVQPLLAVLSGDGKHGEGKSASLAKLPHELQLPGHEVVVEPMAFRAHRWGVLALAVPNNASPETARLVGVLLAACGEQLAARLDAEVQERRLQALHKDLEGQSWLASTGEMAGPLSHEFNNFLNVVLLHAALMEPELPEQLRSELMELRRQAATMTAVVKQFQQYRRRRPEVQELVGLSSVVDKAVRAVAAPQAEPDPRWIIPLPASTRMDPTGGPAGVPLSIVRTTDPPPVVGSAADLIRLCTFLLSNAAAAAGPSGGSVTLRIESSKAKVILRVEDDGPAVSPELLPQLFEPSTVGRPGTNSLELAACEAMVRRMQGKIRCENRAEGGLVVIVELHPAPLESAG